MIFPPEIWEQILLHVDPLALTIFRTVCKCWKVIIDKILKENEHWYKMCKKEIPENLWSTLCETLDPNEFYTEFHEKHDSAMWMAMFKLWMKCKNITKYNTESKCIEPTLQDSDREYITCMTTSGNLLAIGTSGGFIYFYDISKLYTGSMYIADHKEYVQNVQFLRDDITTVCVSNSVNNHVSFWDVDSKKLIEKSRGRLICTSYSYCYIATHNNIIVDGSIPRIQYEFGTDKIIAIGADNNKVLLYTEGGNFVQLTVGQTEEHYTCLCILPPNIRIHRYYIFKPDIVMCITEYGYLGFLVKGKEWKLHNIFPVLHGTPTAVLIYAHILIVGLDSGNVHIYYINDFETLDFNNMTSKKLTLDFTAVISLNIVVVHTEEYLLVAYSKKIYIVKFI